MIYIYNTYIIYIYIYNKDVLTQKLCQNELEAQITTYKQ